MARGVVDPVKFSYHIVWLPRKIVGCVIPCVRIVDYKVCRRFQTLNSNRVQWFQNIVGIWAWLTIKTSSPPHVTVPSFIAVRSNRMDVVGFSGEFTMRMRAAVWLVGGGYKITTYLESQTPSFLLLYVAADSASWLFLSLLNFCILKCTWPLLTLTIQFFWVVITIKGCIQSRTSIVKRLQTKNC